MAAAAALSLSACGRNGALEMPPGPAFEPAPATLGGPPPGPVAADTSGAPPGAPLPPQDTIARTGFDIHGNPAATPGQKKPFLLDPLLQ